MLEEKLQEDLTLICLKNVYFNEVLEEEHLKNDEVAGEAIEVLSEDKLSQAPNKFMENSIKETSIDDTLLFNACRFFSISKEWFDQASHIADCKVISSFLFIKELQSVVKVEVNSNIPLSSTKLMVSAVLPSIENLKKIIGNVISCKEKPSVVSSLFSGHTIQECSNELHLLAKYLWLPLKEMELENCIKNIECLFLVQKYSDVATNIFNIKEKFKLQGDFSEINEMMVNFFFHVFNP